MVEPGKDAADSDAQKNGRPIFVSVGIALFITGFIITVMFSSAGPVESTTSAADSTGMADGRTLTTFESSMAFIGILIGLLGVVTATVGPLMTVVVPKGRS